MKYVKINFKKLVNPLLMYSNLKTGQGAHQISSLFKDMTLLLTENVSNALFAFNSYNGRISI